MAERFAQRVMRMIIDEDLDGSDTDDEEGHASGGDMDSDSSADIPGSGGEEDGWETTEE